MPGTGYDQDAKKIGLNLSKGQRRLAVVVFIASIIVGMLLGSWTNG